MADDGIAEPAATRTLPPGALDIEGVAAIGIDRWRRGYLWPVSDHEFDELADTVLHAYLDAVAGLSGREQDVLKADVGLAAFLLQHLHLSIAAARLRHVSSGLPRGSHVDAHLTPDWAALGKSFTYVANGPSRFVLNARALAKSWVLNDAVPLTSRIAACFGHAKVWALGSRSPLRAAYLAQHVKSCRFLSLEDFRPAAAAPLDGSLERAVRDTVQKICALASRIHPAPFEIEPIADAWIRRLNDLNALSAAVDQIGWLPEKLLLTNSGLPVYRAVALAMRRRGVEIVGFRHGNDMGAQPHPADDIVELIPVDRFVVPSHACLRWRQAAYARSRLSQIQPVQFERVADPLYEQWADVGRNTPLPQAIKSVMIVGYPPNWIRYPGLAGHWALTQLDLEISLIETLSTAGFKVLYKAHPEWEDKLKRIFANINCEFIGGHLEECWHHADAFVFPRTTSTSFGFALCTNRPIVLLNTEGQNWVDEAYVLLARRCQIVPATIDGRLRVRFDEHALVAALKRQVGEPDHTYVDTAMCA